MKPIAALKRWTWLRLSRAMHLEYRMPSGLRVTISSYADWCIYNDIFVSCEYDEAIRRALEKASAAGKRLCVVDIGANVGFFTLRVFELARRSHASFERVDCFLFEASPHLEETIRRNTRQLEGNGVRIELVIGLVGKRSGLAAFDFRQSESGNQVVQGKKSNTTTLSYYDLDNSLGGVGRIDLLKCDIEGSEAEFLDNYPELMRRAQVAVIEFHAPRCPASLGISKVKELGLNTSSILYDQGAAKTVLFEQGAGSPSPSQFQFAAVPADEEGHPSE